MRALVRFLGVYVQRLSLVFLNASDPHLGPTMSMTCIDCLRIGRAEVNYERFSVKAT